MQLEAYLIANANVTVQLLELFHGTKLPISGGNV